MTDSTKHPVSAWAAGNKQTCIFAVLCLGLLALMFNSASYWNSMLTVYDLAHYHTEKNDLPYNGPHFADMHGRLSAMEAHQKGHDVIMSLEPNPLDPFLRANIKPSYTLILGEFGIDRTWLLPLSILTIVTFTLLHSLILRPTKMWHWLVGLLFFVSPPIALGLDRANDDLVLFCLLAPICFLLRKNDSWKPIILAALWISLLSPAKYYPICAALLLVLSSSHLKARWLAFAFTIVLLGLYFVVNFDEVVFMKRHGPKPNTYYSFGAGLLGLYSGFPYTLSTRLPWIMLGALFGAYFLFPKNRKFRSSELRTQLSLNENFFILGAGIHFFCYWLNSNYDYRFIYLALTLPYLIQCVESASLKRTFSIAVLILAFVAFWMETAALWVLYGGDWQQANINDLISLWRIQEVITFSFTLILAWFFVDILYHSLSASLLPLIARKKTQ